MICVPEVGGGGWRWEAHHGQNTQLPESISMSENDFGLDKISFNIRVQEFKTIEKS